MNREAMNAMADAYLDDLEKRHRSVHHAMDWDYERVNLAELEQDRQERLDSEPYEHPYGDDDLDWWRQGR